GARRERRHARGRPAPGAAARVAPGARRSACVRGPELRRSREPVRPHVLRGSSRRARGGDASPENERAAGRRRLGLARPLPGLRRGRGAVTTPLRTPGRRRVARAVRARGDQAALLALFRTSGIADAKVATVRGTARFPSIQAWMYTDVRGWTLDEMIDDRQFASLVAEAGKELRAFVRPDGSVAFDMSGHI